MTQEFIEAYQRGIEGLHAESCGIIASCETCQRLYDYQDREAEFEADIESQAVLDEGSFSWQSCDICHTRLGGTRFDCHALDKDNEIVHLAVCEDCMLYMSNGDLPETWE